MLLVITLQEGDPLATGAVLPEGGLRSITKTRNVTLCGVTPTFCPDYENHNSDSVSWKPSYFLCPRF